MGPSARIRRVAPEPQRIWSRIDHRYSRKRRRQAASTDIPPDKGGRLRSLLFFTPQPPTGRKTARSYSLTHPPQIRYIAMRLWHVGSNAIRSTEAARTRRSFV